MCDCMVLCGRLDNIEVTYTCDVHVLVYIYILIYMNTPHVIRLFGYDGSLI